MFHFLELPAQTPIFKRLQLEEALLRSDERSFCIVHFGSPRAIVMGISGEPEALLHQEKVEKEKLPVIRRFSGGGTVIVDENTLFITFIAAKKDLDVEPFPEPILRWAADLYKEAWKIPGFTLKENDYCIEDRKCGGNAQYIRKDRWLLHTSFLWDFEEKNMEALTLPQKQPHYRQKRSHTDFLCRLKGYGKHWSQWVEDLKKMLDVKPLYISDLNLEELENGSHRKTTHFLFN